MSRIVLFCVMCLCCTSGFLAAEPRSIQDFLTFQDKWPQLAKASTRFNLEGRYGFIGKTEMKFANCPLKFVFPANSNFSAGNARVVEVTGQMELEGTQPVFRIEKISTRPSDQETVTLKRAAIDPRKAADWYALADWVMERGEFYKDTNLKLEALSLRQNGIDVERAEIPPDNYQAVVELARKAVGLGLSTEYAREMRHSAYRKKYQLLLAEKQPNLGELAIFLKENLPGGAKVLTTIEPQVAAQYAADPIAHYKAANAEARNILDRLFVIDVEWQRIERDTKPDGSNGNEIAGRIMSTIPEKQDLVEGYRTRELDFHVSRIGAMTRQEMLDLSQKFVEREELHRVQEVKQKWLLAREPGLRRDRGRGLCDLAEDYITLLADEATANKLYIEAYKVDPGYPLSTVWLTNHGYVLHRGDWIPKDEAPPSGNEQMETAIREGRVILGMTATQVRSALGTEPTAIVRFATSDGRTEVMAFEASGVMVRLKTANRRAECVVVEIGTTSTGSTTGISSPAPATP